MVNQLAVNLSKKSLLSGSRPAVSEHYLKPVGSEPVES